MQLCQCRALCPLATSAFEDTTKHLQPRYWATHPPWFSASTAGAGSRSFTLQSVVPDLGAAAGLWQVVAGRCQCFVAKLHVCYIMVYERSHTSMLPGLIASLSLSDIFLPSAPLSLPILFKGKKEERKLAFWCWVSGYRMILMQHLPSSYVVPKGQYLTLLLPITLCTCRGLWYYCKTL